ncbi:MAG: NAD-dependent epimerase/dehydratase family protein [Pseudomonas sp.]|nr:NAD-dependent epimerase/dehydratase family protein [Pseudomonas sp.]
MNILVTGATGFLGQAVSNALAVLPGTQVLGTTRGAAGSAPSQVPLIAVGDISATTDWSAALQGIEVVVHIAARLNLATDTSANPLAEYRRTNLEGTLALARQALAAGVRRLIFISSVGVNGSVTTGTPFDEASVPEPDGDYARSKFEAEEGLRALVQGTTMDVVLIRPPLIYAAHARRNFPRLLKLVDSGLPLPFAALDNRRSMVALENLVDFIVLCTHHPDAGNQLFLISDGEDASTAQIVRYLAASMGRTPRLLPVPDGLMRWGAKLVGKQNMYTTLCASLQVDSGKARRLLGWVPPLTLEQALGKTGREYKQAR